MEHRYNNDYIMTLILATYLKVTSLPGFIVNATAVALTMKQIQFLLGSFVMDIDMKDQT